ncbi:proton channel OTOP2-like isoform X2 [Takifugu flavidus]|uniref:proton channel OTOP2-like isoform X2 n=1 Tax=Takifugu flavidus TaxID=433684 RepID=UPI00254477D3|nr:proton channel OTOP2-like isoform X2 [Takifugu flavidus]
MRKEQCRRTRSTHSSSTFVFSVLDMNSTAERIFRTCNKLFSRGTGCCSKTPNELVEPRPSSVETETHVENLHHLAHPSPPPPVKGPARHPERAHHGGGWLLSGIICINVLILGCALVTSSAKSVRVTAVHRQAFLIFLLLLTMLWMLFYMVFTSRRSRAAPFKDNHAGPVWLRAGLLLFGLLSLLMDIFKIANFVGFLHCDSAVKVALPVVQAVFLFVQTYFLWVHAKDCVQLQTNLMRCGLALTISTNLVMWMAAVTEESVHQTEIPSVNFSYRMLRGSYGVAKCRCSHSSCDTFKKAFYYLYPFNIEYSLFASALAYVMWKNVGRLVEDHGHLRVKFHPKDTCLGAAAGVLLVLAGLVIFIIYEVDMQRGDEGDKTEALLIYFLMNIIILSLMLLTTLAGCVVYRLDHREHVSEKNPTRSLDVGLLVGASMGQFIISYFTIVAEVATGARGYPNALNLSRAVLTVLQLGLQNYFIIEGLHREPFHTMQEAVVHANAQVTQEQGATRTATESGTSRRSLAADPKKLDWKRRVLKEVCAFLLLANVILWIMPAFGARPEFDHPAEMNIYTFTMWSAIVNIGLPFGIFYRMHSVASLFEVSLMC